MNAWYFAIGTLSILGILFVIALLLPKNKVHNNKSKLTLKQSIPNTANHSSNLQTLKPLIAKVLGELYPNANYQLKLSPKYVVVYYNNDKHTLISLDNDLKTHQRKMGHLKIINFQSLPNEKLIKKYLKDLF